MEDVEREGLTEGEWDESEGLGLMDGEMDGERSAAGADSCGEGSVMRAEGRRASPFRWKKLSTLLLRITDLKERERFSLWSCGPKKMVLFDIGVEMLLYIQYTMVLLFTMVTKSVQLLSFLGKNFSTENDTFVA